MIVLLKYHIFRHTPQKGNRYENRIPVLRKDCFSFEIFPPKKTSSIETIYDTLEALQDLHPDFISVTFGAGGSGNGENTLAIAKR